MRKLAYYSPVDDVCHYLYIDDEGNAAYERYDISKEMQTDHLNNLSEEEMEQWLGDAYGAEEEIMEDEELFLNEFIKYFEVHPEEDEEEEETAEGANEDILYTYKSYKYYIEEEQDHPEERIKRYHTVITPGGEHKSMDFSSTIDKLSEEEFRTWIDLGLPKRDDPRREQRGNPNVSVPLREEDLEYMSKNSDSAESDSFNFEPFEVKTEDGEFFGYTKYNDENMAKDLEKEASEWPEVTETVCYKEDGMWHVGIKGPVH